VDEMEKEKLERLIPKDKFDNSTIKDLMKLNEEEMIIILPKLFDWIKDFNWPIAMDILQIIIKFPHALLPLLRNSLRSEEKDEIQKYWIIVKILPSMSRDIQINLREDIMRICIKPTNSEEIEEVVDVAKEYLKNFNR
jgi:hypothetical protein